MKSALTALLLSLGLTSQCLAQDGEGTPPPPSTEPKKADPKTAPKKKTLDDLSTNELFERIQKTRRAVRMLSRSRRREHRLRARQGMAVARKMADAFVAKHLEQASADQLKEVVYFWMQLQRFRGEVFKTKLGELKANEKLPQGFKDALTAHDAWEAKVFPQIRKVRDRNADEPTRKAAAETLYTELTAYLDAHLLKAFPIEGTRALQTWAGLANRMGKSADVEARMAKLVEQEASAPKWLKPQLQRYKTAQTLKPGKPAPNWTAKALDDGAEVSLAGFKGKLTLVDYWASWCGPCIKLMKEKLMPLQAKYGANAKFQLVSVGLSWRKDTAEKQKARAKKLGTTWKKVFQQSNDVAKAYMIRGIPHLTLVDEEGNILVNGSGWRVIKKIEKLLAERLGGGAPAPAEEKKSGSF